MSYCLLKDAKGARIFNLRVAFLVAASLLIVGVASTSRASEDPRSLFLSEDFFDVFYDASEEANLVDFGA